MSRANTVYLKVNAKNWVTARGMTMEHSLSYMHGEVQILPMGDVSSHLAQMERGGNVALS